MGKIEARTVASVLWGTKARTGQDGKDRGKDPIGVRDMTPAREGVGAKDAGMV